MKALQIHLLGSPEVIYGDRPVSFRTRKVLALFIYLVVEGGMHSRESLMALLWPESEPPKAAATLRVTLTRLRRSLQPAGERLLTEAGSVGFDAGDAVELDTDWLAAAIRPETSPSELAHILERDRGEFLDGFSLPDAPAFDTWAATHREACQRQVETVYDHLTRHYLDSRVSRGAVETAVRWVGRAPLSEKAYRRLMAAQALDGDRTAALQTYDQCRAMLEKEFGIEPERATVLLAERISRDRGVEGHAGRTGERGPAPGRLELALPLVGREEEHGRLVAAFRQAVSETARIIAVIGAAGVGKSRLVKAFVDWVVLDSPGVEIWQGRAFETGGRLPYQPVVEALRHRLEEENAPEDLLDDVWLAELSQLVPELRARYPDLPPPMTGDASFVRSRLFAAVATLGSALAARRPAIFVLDDMQWADGDTRDLVHYIARRWAETGAPVLLLVTVRQESFAADAGLREWLTRLGRDMPFTRLLLDALNGSAVQELVTRLADPAVEDEAARAFGAWLWAETRGLPFFIEALLQMLVEQGSLPLTGAEGPLFDFAAALHHVKSVMRVPPPPGVREVILARLQQLSEAGNALLLAAAVVGRECTFERLCQVADLSETAALAPLETLLDGRLLNERPGARRPYTPTHDYIREVVYDESHEARRRVFHRRALLALEADHAPAAECAYHALASLLDEPAFRFSLAAGDEALATWAFEESLGHYERARDVAQRMGVAAGTISAPSLKQLYLKRGQALELAEDFEGAQVNYDEMLILAAELGDRPMELAALTALCVIHARHNPIFDPQRAREEGQAALNLARTLDDPEAEARASWGLMLVGIYGGGSGEVIRAFGRRSLSLARELGLTELVGYVLINLCWPYLAQKELAAAVAALDEARDIWQELGNQPMLLETYDMRQFVLSVTGDYEGLQEAAREVLRLCDVTGNQGYRGAALRFTALVHILQGRFEQALVLLDAALSLPVHRSFSVHAHYDSMLLLYSLAGAPEQAEQWADKLAAAIQERSMPVFECYYLTNIARAKVARGRLAEGQAILDRALEMLPPDAPWSHTINAISIVFCHLHLARGEPERVFDRLDERVAGYRQAGFRYSLPEEYWLRGRAEMALGRYGAARKALLHARETAEAQEERYVLWQIMASLAEVEAACGDTHAAGKLRDEAREVVGYIAEHAGDLHDTFVARPAVQALLGES